MNRDADIVVIAQEIKHYFEAHPNAADSIDGIIKWWLQRQRYLNAIEKIGQALEYLTVHGEIKKTVTPGGRTIYSNAEITPGKGS